ncbi:MAG: HAMP domain-containing sensor histidine kinase, partial [Ferruginibacter sp.]
QNPLNFVNNFSEVSNELIEELKIEKGKSGSDRDEQLENEILNDIKSNLEKINHHGKRADAIVKGMLQHSRSSAGVGAGVKEPTDINKLADEYLRLSYHGLRAKDKSFNATIKTDFDESLNHVNIIPQDIGRVILNLLTNAFYAVNEKKKEAPQPPEGGAEYVPTVIISTKRTSSPSPKESGQVRAEGLLISVSDNGNGIPDGVKEKIFQPFFTTKPSGSGTGLGLSMSYDIVKAHGGEIKVVSDGNSGTEFIISLPLNRS